VRFLNWVAVTPGEWRLGSWTAKGEVAQALKEFEGWHPQVRAIIGTADVTNRLGILTTAIPYYDGLLGW
jgi:salicylate hydroxylase